MSQNTHESTVSIEICHLYLDKLFSNEQKKSIEVFKSFSSDLVPRYDTCILFDNYNIKKIRSKPEEVIKKIEKQGININYWAYEKDLILYADEVLNNIHTKKIKNQYIKYIEKYNKYPCSLLTATWYLLRLGYIKDSKGIVNTNHLNTFTKSASIINVLPNYFAPVEKKAEKLISSYATPNLTSKIENHYFSLPVVAKNNIPKKVLVNA